MATEPDIPIIDFSCMSLKVAEEHIDTSKLQILSAEVRQTLQDWGIMYIQRHGFNRQWIHDVLYTGRQMLNLPEEIKSKFSLHDPVEKHGWMRGKEITNYQRPIDLKEIYTYTNMALSWNEYVPTFDCAFQTFHASGMKLARRILQTIAVSLHLERYYFDQYFQTLDSINCRYTQYPKPEGGLKDNQAWCGEHTDFGALTLNFQDMSVGGLQVRRDDGTFKEVPPVVDSIVVNLGDMMMRWTANKYRALIHRVIPPPDIENYNGESRESVIWFGNPDGDCVIECLDGSNKYTASTSGELQRTAFTSIYNTSQ